MVKRDHGVLVTVPKANWNPDVPGVESPRPGQGADVLDVPPRTRPDGLAKSLDRPVADRRHSQKAPVGRGFVTIGLLDKETWIAANQPADEPRAGVEQPWRPRSEPHACPGQKRMPP